MSKTAIFFALMLCSVMLYGQDIIITFSASGAATQIDHVVATNLRSNQSVTLPGNDTLILAVNTSVLTLVGIDQSGFVFPNPFSGRTTLVVSIRQLQTVYVKVHNLIGQAVAQTSMTVQPGVHEFVFSASAPGIYVVSLTTDQGTTSFKIICTNASETGDRIEYSGMTQGYDPSPMPNFKRGIPVYSLGFTIGDVVYYNCSSGIYRTVMTDSPAASKNYEVEFVACTDPDGKDYGVVKIGGQIWMAENLAYLPSVSPPATGSDSLIYFYVYGYEGTSVDVAKDSANYATYGVLYNWTAAMDSSAGSDAIPSGIQGICPSGWHMPSDGEWKILEKNLGMSQLDADTVNWRNSEVVGKKLKATIGWPNNGNGTNISGFGALPGGYRNTHGSFNYIDNYALFWSASLNDTLSWYRNLYFNEDGVFRHATLKSHGFSIRCVKD